MHNRLEVHTGGLKTPLASVGALQTSSYDQYNSIQCIELVTSEMSNAVRQKTTASIEKRYDKISPP